MRANRAEGYSQRSAKSYNFYTTLIVLSRRKVKWDKYVGYEERHAKSDTNPWSLRRGYYGCQTWDAIGFEYAHLAILVCTMV